MTLSQMALSQVTIYLDFYPNPFDPIRPQSIRPKLFDQKGRPNSFRPISFDPFHAIPLWRIQTFFENKKMRKLNSLIVPKKGDRNSD